MFPVKDPEERINITFDFSDQYKVVSNPAVKVCLENTLDDIPSMKLSPAGFVSPNIVVIQIGGGTPNTKYDIRCAVDTDTSEHIVLKDVLPVRYF